MSSTKFNFIACSAFKVNILSFSIIPLISTSLSTMAAAISSERPLLKAVEVNSALKAEIFFSSAGFGSAAPILALLSIRIYSADKAIRAPADHALFLT
ncbi:hypothetical protein ES705_22687 [subsurface metagenome]